MCKSMRAALCLLGLMASCADPEVPPGPPYRAQVIALEGFDQNGDAQFALDTRELTTLADFRALDGQHLRVLRGGELVINAVTGSVVNDGRMVGGSDPALRYELEDGVVIPKDYPSLIMLSSYAGYEQVILELERVVGAPIDELAAQWPQIEVFFEPVIRVEGDVDATLALKFNAFYLSGKKQFGLAQRSDIEQVPLAANLMVVSHEFGHLLFEEMFFRGLAPDCDEEVGPTTLQARLDHEYVVSGLNEGFADFIAFSVTGGTDPFSDVSFVTDRDLIDTEFVYDDLVADLDSPAEARGCTGAFYCLGTLFARSLVESMPALGLDPARAEDRGVLSRQVVSALDGALARMEAGSESLPDLSTEVEECARADELDADYDGQILGAFLQAFVDGLPAESQGPICEQLILNFGDQGFPQEARGSCVAS